MIWAGLATGLVLYAVNLSLIVLTLRRANLMPEEEAPRYMATRYYIRYGILVAVVGVLAWFGGLKFALGIMGGLVLGKFLLLIAGALKQDLFVRLLKGGEEKEPDKE